ncbi:HAD-IA family hydrolase [Actinomadura rayongensis]|uniref:HAD-IA family hydrolase n=1 Tax=Actinomadura rayongensis TaxID=1429076 RepID=A0A6I4WBM1_9ACTN|nr:HAD-IA family hydrolase [Actinomadura rayongensis]MXQ68299.1 HAD-IA family hydrolase [Actinomadura rayongensis]
MRRTPAVVAATALLLDMDGTLLDSTAVVERTWRDFARRHGLDAAAILAVSHGRPTAETVAEFAPPGADVAAETARITAAEVRETDGIVPVPGAPDLLAALPPDRWALVTSADRALALARMRAAGLPLPSVVVTADDVAAGKPSPEGFRTAARRLGVAPASALAFEDSPAGLLAAHAAVAATVLVGPGPLPDGVRAERVRDLRDVRVTAGGPSGGLRVRLTPS